MDFIEILKVLVLGIVEGFTEWLPISSTGHMILVDEIIQLHVTEEFMKMFRVVIQLGAILAVVVLYFHRLNPFDRGKTQGQKIATVHLWIKIAVACLPAAVFGLAGCPFVQCLCGSSHAGAVRSFVYCIGKQKPVHRISHSENRSAQLPDCSLYRTVSGAFPDSGNFTFRSNDSRRHDSGLFPGGGGGVFFLPGYSCDVWRKPSKNPEIRF